MVIHPGKLLYKTGPYAATTDPSKPLVPTLALLQ